MSPSVVVGQGGGATHHTCAVCVWMDKAGWVNSPPRHYPPPSPRVRGVRVYWREAGLGSNSCLVHNPPLLSVYVITVSSLHRNANLAFLFFRVPRSCIKFVFPRARFPRIPGKWEHETRNARPSLMVNNFKRDALEFVSGAAGGIPGPKIGLGLPP